MKTSIEIGKIMGIPIKLHITFLLILPVFAWMFTRYDPEFGFNDVEPLMFRYSLGLATSVLLFTCVLLHELGHSYVARKHGSNINNITLFLFGGVSSMEETPKDPKIELKMAVAGPAVSLLIGSALIMIHGIIRQESLLNVDHPYMRLIWIVGFLNIVLCLFNLIPAFPMDGGRVLRAWLAGKMPYIKATRTAAGIGKMFAILMGFFGFFYNIMLTLIAFFIYIGASEEEKSTEVTVTLEGVKVRDIMSREVKTVSVDTTIEELVDIMFKYKHMGYPVLDGSKITGMVTFTDVQKIPRENRKNTRVSQIMIKELITASEDDDAVTVLKLLTRNSIGRILIKNDDKMIGIVSRTDVLRAVQLLE